MSQATFESRRHAAPARSRHERPAFQVIRKGCPHATRLHHRFHRRPWSRCRGNTDRRRSPGGAACAHEGTRRVAGGPRAQGRRRRHRRPGECRTDAQSRRAGQQARPHERGDPQRGHLPRSHAGQYAGRPRQGARGERARALHAHGTHRAAGPPGLSQQRHASWRGRSARRHRLVEAQLGHVSRVFREQALHHRTGLRRGAPMAQCFQQRGRSRLGADEDGRARRAR